MFILNIKHTPNRSDTGKKKYQQVYRSYDRTIITILAKVGKRKLKLIYKIITYQMYYTNNYECTTKDCRSEAN